MTTALAEPAAGVLIGGEWRSAGRAIPVLDKFTRQPAALVRQARPGDARDAVTAAAAAAAMTDPRIVVLNLRPPAKGTDPR